MAYSCQLAIFVSLAAHTICHGWGAVIIYRPVRGTEQERISLVKSEPIGSLAPLLFMKADTHPKYVDAEIRCACGNVIKTRSTKPTILVGICNVCHPFYTGTQKFVDTAGRVDKFQQRLAKTQAAQAAQATAKKKKK